jgi:predicted nucleic acid-binding protein
MRSTPTASPSPLRLAILDSGPLIAASNTRDPRFDAAQNALQMGNLVIVTPVMVATETSLMIGRRYGPEAEASFIRGLGELDVRTPQPDDWARIADLVHQYRNFPLGGVDASVVALAERLDTDLLITFDHRHFAAIKPRHAPHFTLLPGSS